MSDENGAGAGTATETGAGSQAPQNAVNTESAGGDAASTAAEPTVEVGGKQYPASQVELALKNHEHFTADRQALAEQQRDLERRTMELAPLADLGKRVSTLDPAALERLRDVDPDLAASIPGPQALVNQALLADNLTMRFDKFTAAHPELDEAKLTGIRGEALRLAQSGDFNAALSFDDIAMRLYRDDIINALADRKLRDAAADAARQQRAATTPPGMPVIPSDGKAPRGIAALSAGHRETAAKK